MDKKIENSFKQSPIKYILGFLFCLLIRLIPFRTPNAEPIMTTIMPFGKKWGWIAGALFGALSIVLFDLIVKVPGFPRMGIWTLITASTYGLIGALAGIYLKNRSKIRHYAVFALVSTLIYDFITGPIMSSFLFKMPFSVALIGQIPFTLIHVGVNIVGAIIISPLLYRWVINNPLLDTNNLLKHFSVTG